MPSQKLFGGQIGGGTFGTQPWPLEWVPGKHTNTGTMTGLGAAAAPRTQLSPFQADPGSHTETQLPACALLANSGEEATHFVPGPQIGVQACCAPLPAGNNVSWLPSEQEHPMPWFRTKSWHGRKQTFRDPKFASASSVSR